MATLRTFASAASQQVLATLKSDVTLNMFSWSHMLKDQHATAGTPVEDDDLVCNVKGLFLVMCD